MGMHSSYCSNKLTLVRIFLMHYNIYWFIQSTLYLYCIHAVPCRVIWFSISCTHGTMKGYIFQYLVWMFIPCLFVYTLHMIFITMLYNAYVAWFSTEEAICGAYSKVWREWSSKQYPIHWTNHHRSHLEMDLHCFKRWTFKTCLVGVFKIYFFV